MQQLDLVAIDFPDRLRIVLNEAGQGVVLGIVQRCLHVFVQTAVLVPRLRACMHDPVALLDPGELILGRPVGAIVIDYGNWSVGNAVLDGSHAVGEKLASIVREYVEAEAFQLSAPMHDAGSRSSSLCA
ncbi:MAG: hypothetical protein U5K43_03135 [Halofilum sp. (in: g-proteobacteria)]|nr:hypothetical protein [Halofilum sp. (in: g-proteobacteria)]